MNKNELKVILEEEKNKYANKTYDDLIKIVEPVTYTINSGQNTYQIEVQLVEKNDKYLNVSISIDDGSLIRSMFPLTAGIIINKK